MGKIKEVIIVEGKDDEAAIKRACNSDTIATHGFGISEKTLRLIERAYKERGILIFTDPDYAGELIRKRLNKKFPMAKNAWILKEQGEKNGDIGIENANPDTIKQALSKAKAITCRQEKRFFMKDIIEAGLVGGSNGGKRRGLVGASLGIGYCNSKTFINRLNMYDISREAFEKAVINIGEEAN